MKIKIADIVRELMVRDGNVSQMQRPVYMSYVKTVVTELKLFNLRKIARLWVKVDKGTNSVQLPEGVMNIASISVEDDCGNIVPLCYNSDTKLDSYIEEQESACGCSCGCTNPYCSGVKETQQTEETVSLNIPIGRYIPIVNADTEESACTDCDLPSGVEPDYLYDAVDYTKTTQLVTCPNGDIVRRICEPSIKYKRTVTIPIVFKNGDSACYNCEPNNSRTESYIYDGVEEICNEALVCSVVVKSCGCIEETPSNKKVLNSCGVEVCCNKTMRQMNIYSEDNCRVHFPDGFPHNKVLVKYYETFEYTDTYIPEYAREAVITGVEYRMALRNPRKTNVARFVKMEHNEECRKLNMILRRLRNGEILSAILGNQNEIQ